VTNTIDLYASNSVPTDDLNPDNIAGCEILNGVDRSDVCGAYSYSESEVYLAFGIIDQKSVLE